MAHTFWTRRAAAMVTVSLLLTLPTSTVMAQNVQELAESASKPHNIKTVFLIIMENHNWTGDTAAASLKGNTAAPYINFNLIPMGAHASHYWNPPHTHPSLPNYMWLEAGTSFGIHGDGSALKYGQSTHEHLAALLDKKGISWRGYDESTNGTTCPLSNWHNPFVFFHDETNNNDFHYQRCIDHVRPFKEFSRDLGADTVARYNFIVPNICNSMHNPCGENQITTGDEWLKTNVPAILKSNAYRSGGVIFILWDEAKRGDGPIPLIVLSPFAKAGFTSSVHYSHGSTLRTLQEIFGVGPLLRGAATEPDLRDMFTAFP